LVHSGSQSDLHRFQVEPAVVTPLLKSNPQEPVYFTDNFLADCLRRFFSCAVCWVSSTGRKRQIFRFTWTNSPVKVWNSRKVAISLSALRTAAGEGRF
jgi:hypothetical protein